MSFRRLRRHRAVRWCVALALAASTASVVVGTISRGEAMQRAWGPTRPVAVAVHDLPAGAVIRDADIEVRQWPAAMVPAGALAAPPTGRTVRVDVFAGEALVGPRMAGMGIEGVAALLPDGWLALAIPLGDAALTLHPGDVVVLLATLDPTAGASGPPTVTVADHARVVAVSERSITVAVPSALAPKVAYAAVTGAITPALRAGG
jgi:pilus assembly protein CpaB